MKMLVLVLNKVDKLESLLFSFSESGIKGATVLDSYGMAKVLSDNEEELPLFASLRMLLNEKRPFNKTIFTILDDIQVSTAINCIRTIVGDLSKPGIGILFTIPLDYTEGIRL
jgi:hypothetical protein